MKQVLHQDFFKRPVLRVAPELLGKFLVRKYRGKEQALMITEVEAYDGERDKACHAYKGRTKRTEVMFGPAGRWYVYLIYGMYDMLNIVTGEEGYPAAVLIRTCQYQGEALILDGPGKLTRELKITRKLNGLPAVRQGKNAKKTCGLWIEDRGFEVAKKDIIRTPRIGIDYAEEWAKKRYRFILR